MKKLVLPVFIVIIALFCTNVTAQQNPSKSSAITSRCDMATRLIQQKKFNSAVQILTPVYKKYKNHARTLMLLGLCMEHGGHKNQAIQIYRNYYSVKKESPYKRICETRYSHLIKELYEGGEVKRIFEMEQQFKKNEKYENTVAVYPFTYLGKNEKFKALTYGLSEMLITDISQVDEINLVERLRINLLMKELALGQTGMLDPETSAKSGRLLGARQIVSGTYDVFADESIRIDIDLWNKDERDRAREASRTHRKENMFIMEKGAALAIIQTMGFPLTKNIRRKIIAPPTADLDAFVDFSFGLKFQAEGKLELAEESFKKALDKDSGFQLAHSHLVKTRTMRTVGTDEIPSIKKINDYIAEFQQVRTYNPVPNAWVKSVVLPGWGQAAQSKPVRKWLFSSVFVGCGVAAGYFANEYNVSVIEYEDKYTEYMLNRNLDLMEAQRQAIYDGYSANDDALSMRNNMLYALGAVWTINFLDAVLLPPKFTETIQLTSSFDKDVFRVGFAVNLNGGILR